MPVTNMRRLHDILNMSSMRKKLIYPLIIFIFYAMLEVTCRLAFRQEDELSGILLILQQDPVLFWKQRPRLSLIFQGTKLQTNSMGLRNREFAFKKDKNTFRIVCLGASPTLGWGVNQDDAYPSQLERILKQRYRPGKSVEVVNAGIIGYTSYQGKIFLKNNVLRLSPDVIVVSYLINDLDKYRFYRSNPSSDKELKPKNRVLVWFENMLDRSKLYRVFRRVALRLARINTKLYGRPLNVYPQNRRVSIADYKENLREIAAIAGKNGIKVVFINMSVHPPFIAEQPGDSLGGDIEINRSLACAKSGMYDAAIEHIKKAIARNPRSAPAYYYLGVYLQAKKEFRDSEIYLQKAKEMELYDCVKLSKSYNEAMEEVASQNGIPLVDAISAFKVASQGKDEIFFINPGHDIVHPNAAGHATISRELYNKLLEYNLLP